MFFGEFPRRLNSKHQVPVPARLREVVPEDDKKNGFYLVRSRPDCLYLFTHGDVVDKIKQTMLTTRPGERRDVTRRVMPIDMDGQGRILVPTDFRKAAGITGDVIFIGNVDRIEIWAPDRLKKADKVRSAKSRKRIEGIMSDLFE